MQDPIVITGTNQEISEVISAELYDRLDGQLTLSFRTQIKNITSLTAGDEIALNGQIFRVTSVNRSIARGLYDLQAQSEHESMALTDQEVDEFAVSGRADGLLARIFEGSGFVAENRTGKNPYVTFEHTGKVNRRALLNEMCRKLGAEIEYEGRVINLVNHRGSIDRYEIAQRCPVMEFTANDNTDGVSYELVTDALYNVMVGDEVRITTDLPVEKQADVRVIGIRYNPFYTKRVVIEMGVPQKNIVDEIIDDRDRLKDYVEEDRFEDKVSSSVDTYIRSEEGKSSIEHVLSGKYLTRDEATGFVTETTLEASIKAYVDSPSGIAGIEEGLRGTFQTKNDMGDYVEKAELSTEIGQYIDSSKGTAKIVSAASGTYQKKSDMAGYAKTSDIPSLDGYVEKTELSTEIGQYIDTQAGTGKIISAMSGTYQKQSDMAGYAKTSDIPSLDGYVEKTELSTEIGQYIDTQAGTGKIISAMSGTYQKQSDMTGYVEKTELSTEIGQYIDTQAGTGKIISAMSGTYQKQSDMTGYAKTSDIPSLDGYVEKTELSTEIGQYIDTQAGTGKIISAMSGTYQKTSDMSSYAKKTDIPSLDGYVKTTALNTSIGQYIDSTTGTAKVVSAASGTYQKKSDMGDYAKTSAITSIEQSVSDVESAITLSSSYSKNTIGTNVYALLQLVSNANSSSIKINADKIDFTGFTTFLKASDLGSSGTTSIDGGRITTGTISAARIDVDNLSVKKIYGTSSYKDTALMYSDGNKLYLGGASITGSKVSEMGLYATSSISIYAGSTIYIGTYTTKSIEIYTSSTAGYIRPSLNGGVDLGHTNYRWNYLYTENALIGNSTYNLTFDEKGSITPSTTSISDGYFYIGTSAKPFQALYVKNATISGTAAILGASLKIGNTNVTTYYVNITDNTVAPSINTTSKTFNLGTSTAYWHYAYIGSSASYIGNSTSSKLGFFGTTPVTRQTVSSSATVSTLITALKAYGLIG